MAKPERRQSKRTPLQIPVDYSSVDDFFSEMATNINEGGMFIETDQPGEIGELVKVQFRLPNTSEPAQVEARVAWVSRGEDGPAGPAGMGVEFQDLSGEVRETLNALVRSLRSRE